MFVPPKVEDYAAYGDFALAALGYALVTQGLAGVAVGVVGDSPLPLGLLGWSDGRATFDAGPRACAACGFSGDGALGRGTCGSGVPVGGGGAAGDGGCDGGVPAGVGTGDGASGATLEGRSGGGRDHSVAGGGAGGTCGLKRVPAPVVAGQMKRGPNFARNHANRTRKRLAREQRRQAVEMLLGEDGEGRKGKFDALPDEQREALVETHAERLILENREKIAELEEKAMRRARGVNHLVDAMRLLRLSKEAQEMEGLGSKADGVLGWAQTVSSSLSESVARASSIGSFGSGGTVSTGVSAGSSASQGKQDFSSEKLRRTKFEQFLITDLGWPDRRLVQVRTRVRRCLELKDVIGDSAAFSLSRKDQLAAMSWVAGYDVESFR